MVFYDIDLNNLEVICSKINEIAKDKEHIIFLLYGDVGAGKTSLIKEYVRLCGIYDYVEFLVKISLFRLFFNIKLHIIFTLTVFQEVR